MYILSRAEMRAIDHYTVNNVKIPARILMELAGKGCFDFIKDKLPQQGSVAVFCGNGNNGGDGFVIARWLKNNGYSVVVFLVGELDKMSQETRANYDLLTLCQVPAAHINNADDWQKVKQDILSNQQTGKVCYNYDMIVDTLFGVGFHGKLPPLIAEIIADINELQVQKAAIDISSGLDADNGLAENAFRADFTLTMAAPKYGHYLGRGREFSGDVVTIDIGIPESVWEKKQPQMTLTEKVTFPARSITGHKGDYGKVAVIAGSSGYTGAAVLSCKAALKSGAGLITLFHFKGLETIFESSLTEIMTKIIAVSEEEIYSDKEKTRFSSAMMNLLDKLHDYDVLLIGPGLGKSPLAAGLVDLITSHWDKPAVFDADALNILAENRGWLERLKNKPFILTPHIGEFCRLMNVSKDELLTSPVDFVSKFSREYGCSLLLKSSYRLFANNKQCVLDVSGNDGLATGGSGDVLAGIITSFIGQNSTVADAAIAASYLMGKTAERCALHYGTQAITPTMIIDNIFRK